VLLRFSLSAAQRSWASLRAILPQGISQMTTPSSPAPPGASTDPPAEVRGLVHLDASTILSQKGAIPLRLHRVLVQDQALHSYGLASMISRCCSTLVLLELVPAPTHLTAGCCVVVQRDRRWR
jgi:hypothetical protein